jgi:hypothetical protein
MSATIPSLQEELAVLNIALRRYEQEKTRENKKADLEALRQFRDLVIRS